MRTNTPQTLKGFRDFLPQEKRERDYIAEKVIETFKSFGFAPLQNPTLEYASLLLGKYGKEADKLVYTFQDRGGREVGLRYDQTVPAARVLTQYQEQLPKFFRRYQIQSVFRADKPQKGRYREFTQCDIDIFGSDSPISDAEILACTYAAFKNIGYPQIILMVNDRKTLIDTLSEFSTQEVDVFSIIQSIDKLDKLEPQTVISELVEKGLEKSQAEKALSAIEQATPTANLKQITEAATTLGVPSSAIKYTPTLARGLDYYTGMIFEILLPNYKVGSCGGGGRYDKLIGQLSGKDPIPAVGVGLGFDRMVEAAKEMNLIPTKKMGSQVLVTLFSKETEDDSLNLARKLREAEIKTEIYPAFDKLAKQFKYADKLNIPFVAIIGEEEAKSDQVTLKNMRSGEQILLNRNAFSDISRFINRQA